jgi:hypothetical protein
VPAVVYWFRGIGDGKFGSRQVLLDSSTEDSTVAMSTGNLIDYDGDGDLDIIVGDVKGYVSLSLNEGTKAEPKFLKRGRLKVGSNDLKVVQKSDPWPVDWDGDGRIDLLIGDEAGDASFFRGREDGSFEQGVSLFTGEPVDPARKYMATRRLLDEHGRVIPGYRLRLTTHDWNGDGKLDLLVGNCEPKGEGKVTTGYVRVLLQQ